MSELDALLSDYNIPEDELKKLEELDKTQPPAEAVQQDVPEPVDQPQDDKTEVEVVTPQKTETEEKPAEVTKVEDKKEEDQKPDQLTPFHEHPDWKKMQERVSATERRAEEAERRAEEAERKALQTSEQVTNPDKYTDLTSAEDIADKMLREKKQAGWDPKDQLEVTKEYTKSLREAENIIAKRQERAQEEYNHQMNIEFQKAGVETKEDKAAVTSLLLEWVKEGKSVTFASVETAVNQLKIAGKIGKPATTPETPPATPPTEPETPPEPTPEEKAEAQRKAQADANKKISRSKSGSPSNQDNKPTLKYIRDNDLDQIILDQAAKLE